MSALFSLFLSVTRYRKALFLGPEGICETAVVRRLRGGREVPFSSGSTSVCHSLVPDPARLQIRALSMQNGKHLNTKDSDVPGELKTRICLFYRNLVGLQGWS